ncbi:hypothetical protein [Thalassotalea sp. Y01]|uniref:LA_2272 family surface repeat-containing protein n=1 Tax=Thalassotalea sp. Y01 TaxID=2729613 RepID=UPI00145F6083|nr:hypothetical protein [Thalassotalea sp. Y01]NMP14956.1 hypothetical protein [Thalassotalea sp. Y01]
MKKPLLAASLLALSTSVFAENIAQLSLPDTNLPEGDVKGARLATLWGKTDNVKGFEIALFGLAESNNFSGLHIGLYGAQRVRNDFTGVALSIANWHDNNATGGVLGVVNYTKNNITGAQLGLVNYAGTLNGLQFGLINATTRINKGVQIGLINYDESGTFVDKNLKVFPIINARF